MYSTGLMHHKHSIHSREIQKALFSCQKLEEPSFYNQIKRTELEIVSSRNISVFTTTERASRDMPEGSLVASKWHLSNIMSRI
jgi:hypothetical protein